MTAGSCIIKLLSSVVLAFFSSWVTRQSILGFVFPTREKAKRYPREIKERPEWWRLRALDKFWPNKRNQKILPECQMDNNVEDMCSETSCYESESMLSYSPHHWISQSFKRFIKRFFLWTYGHQITSSATSSPLRTKFPCLFMETTALMFSISTASSLSVFRKIM